MKRKELTKTFMEISKWKKPFVLLGYINIFQRFNLLTAGAAYIRVFIFN